MNTRIELLLAAAAATGTYGVDIGILAFAKLVVLQPANDP